MKRFQRCIGLMLALVLTAAVCVGCGSDTSTGSKRKTSQSSSTQLNKNTQTNKNNQSGKNNQTNKNNQSNKNNQPDKNNQTTTADPNGYTSRDALLDVLVRMQFGKSVTKSEYKKTWPQEIWDNLQEYDNGEGATFENSYAAVTKRLESLNDRYASKYGADYTVTYSIDRTENMTAADFGTGPYTQEELDAVYKIWGVHPNELSGCRVDITVTIQGSKGSERVNYELTIVKAGNKWYDN